MKTSLRKSERRVKTLVEEINDGYFVVQDQRITFANKGVLPDAWNQYLTMSWGDLSFVCVP